MKYVILVNPHDADTCFIAQEEQGKNKVFNHFDDAITEMQTYISVKAAVLAIDNGENRENHP